MIIITIFNYLILLSIFGYAFIFKKIIKKDLFYSINNYDFFYGLFIIVLLSIFINFFAPLKFFSIPVVIIGLLLFFYGKKIKIYNVNFIFYLIIIPIISFFSYFNGNNVDSPMYHLQVLKWISEHKISLGLTNLEMRLGNNSSWHSFLALVDIGFKSWSAKYYVSNILVAVITVQVISQKTLSLSNLFLFLSVCYLVLFSYLHPFNNGIILNHLGNPEVDIASMVLFFFSIYLFLKLVETNFINNELVDLLTIVIFLSITIKLSNVGLVLIPLYIFFKNRQYFFFNSLHYVILLASFLWTVRSFFISGCFLFPLKSTCFSTPWLASTDKIEHYSKIIMGFARDTRLRDKYTNFEYIIDSNEWILPWFHDYFLNTSLLKISTALLLLSIFIAILFLVLNKSFYIQNIVRKNFIFFLIYFIITILIWFQAPEIRFGWGWIIGFPCVVISGLVFHLQCIKKVKRFYFSTVLVGLLVLLVSKHLEKFQMQQLFSNKKIFNYEKIVKIGNYSNIDFYKSINHECLDFIEVCVNQPKKKYSIMSKFGYKIYLSEEF
jgi:hypothetical protein